MFSVSISEMVKYILYQICLYFKYRNVKEYHNICSYWTFVSFHVKSKQGA